MLPPGLLALFGLLVILLCTTTTVAGSDPYSTLGISRRASTAEIKSAYRRLAVKLHPDQTKGGGTHDQFLELQARVWSCRRLQGVCIALRPQAAAGCL